MSDKTKNLIIAKAQPKCASFDYYNITLFSKLANKKDKVFIALSFIIYMTKKLLLI